MLHLFNEVFIEQDSKILIYPVEEGSPAPESVYQVCVISREYATYDLRENPAVMYIAETIDELLGSNEWTTIEDFLRDIATYNFKIVIYADKSVFAEIFTCVLKTLTHMERPQLDTYLSVYEWRCITNSKHYGNLYDLMKASWDISPVYDFSDLDLIPSYEFALASAFVNPDFSKKDKLKLLMGRFIKREYEDVILEVRKHIDSIIHNQDVQILLGREEYVSDITIDNFKTLFPRLQVYDLSFFREDIYGPVFKAYRPGSWSRGESKINLALATTEQRQAICEFAEEFLFLVTNCEGLTSSPDLWLTRDQVVKLFVQDEWQFMESVCTGDGLLTDEEYLVALAQLRDDLYGLPHVPLDLRESILLHFIPYLKSLYKQGNLEELQKYSLK